MTETLHDFPYEPRHVSVGGVRLAYVEHGAGPPLVLVHGNPTWSYQWRGVIPLLAARFRCIAVDLVGMGRSDKPDLAYDFFDHLHHYSGALDALGIADALFVLHDWGTALGLDDIRLHPARARGVAIVSSGESPLEGVLASIPSWDVLPPPARALFEDYWHPERGHRLVIEQNHFIEATLPGGIMRTLARHEMDAYRLPFPTPASRRPILAWNRQVPIAGEPPAMRARIDTIGDWLAGLTLPILMIHPDRGGAPSPYAQWMRARATNVREATVGPGGHYLPEDQPAAIARAVLEWAEELGKRQAS